MNFTLREPNPYDHVTDAMWWFWLELNAFDPKIVLGGIYAKKKGFHNTGAANEKYWPGNYSIRDYPNRSGPWWRDYASAIDLTFPEAQRGDYSRISIYSQRLLKAMRDPNDPRPGMVIYQFFGQADDDLHVEGYNEYKEENASSDSSHLWHIHAEIFRNKCGDFYALYALLTILKGWSVEQWKQSLLEGNLFCNGNATSSSGLSYDPAAEYLQLNLIDLGQKIDPDGYYGPLTCKAVVAELVPVLGKELVGDGSKYGPKLHKAMMDLQYTPTQVSLPKTVSMAAYEISIPAKEVEVTWK